MPNGKLKCTFRNSPDYLGRKSESGLMTVSYRAEIVHTGISPLNFSPIRKMNWVKDGKKFFDYVDHENQKDISNQPSK